TGLYFPVGITPGALEQVLGDALEPLRLDAGELARVEPVGLDQFSGDHPAQGLARERRSGPQIELGRARTEVVRFILRLDADISDQAGQQGEVHLFVGARCTIETPA